MSSLYHGMNSGLSVQRPNDYVIDIAQLAGTRPPLNTGSTRPSSGAALAAGVGLLATAAPVLGQLYAGYNLANAGYNAASELYNYIYDKPPEEIEETVAGDIANHERKKDGDLLNEATGTPEGMKKLIKSAIDDMQKGVPVPEQTEELLRDIINTDIQPESRENVPLDSGAWTDPNLGISPIGDSIFSKKYYEGYDSYPHPIGRGETPTVAGIPTLPSNIPEGNLPTFPKGAAASWQNLNTKFNPISNDVFNKSYNAGFPERPIPVERQDFYLTSPVYGVGGLGYKDMAQFGIGDRQQVRNQDKLKALVPAEPAGNTKSDEAKLLVATAGRKRNNKKPPQKNKVSI